jgi:hypothetical protein
MHSSRSLILYIAILVLTGCEGRTENPVSSESKAVNPASKTLDASSRDLVPPSGAPNSALLTDVPKALADKGLISIENRFRTLNMT